MVLNFCSAKLGLTEILNTGPGSYASFTVKVIPFLMGIRFDFEFCPVSVLFSWVFISLVSYKLNLSQKWQNIKCHSD
jgi:hypothetical protein